MPKQQVTSGRLPRPSGHFAQATIAEARGRLLFVSGMLAKGADGNTLLTVDEPFDRAWRRVGLALDRVGFTVEDRDRSKGLYYVRYVDPKIDSQTKDGILSKLAFWRSDNEPGKAAQYQIRVSEGAAASQVQVLNKEGGTEASRISNQILGLLYDQLK